jgi:hypothetical protein
LEEILKEQWKNFRKSDNLFLFWDYLKIKYEYDPESEIQNLSFVLENDKYTIDSLETDLWYYKKIFSLIKDNIWTIANQSLSSNIKINKFYTPEYLFKKYSEWYSSLEVKMEDNIILKRNLDKEELNIRAWANLEDITDTLKSYIKLTL